MTLALDADYVQLDMFKGEGKTVTFVLTLNDTPLDVSAATFSMVAKRKLEDAAYLFSYADAVFDKADAAAGRVSVMLQAADTRLAPAGVKEEIYLQLKTTFAGGGGVDLSHILKLVLGAAVVHE